MAGSGTALLRTGDMLVQAEHLSVEFRTAHGTVHAVSDVSFDLAARETLGIVGESGCGKSTTARSLIHLPPPTSGTVRYRGRDLTAMSREAMRTVRPDLQMIFQDPISSLNPRRPIRQIIGEGLRLWPSRGGGDPDRVDELMAAVGIDPRYGDRKPHQFSGGQCQRISIARALALDPEVIICDEPVSALDVSVQAQILNLLEDMKAKYGLSLVFISHDLSVVKNISDRVMVMYLGKVCEVGPPDQLYARPAHPYTAALLDSVPDAAVDEPRIALVEAELPSALDPPSGCRFRTRCPRAQDICATREPEVAAVAGTADQWVACHFPLA